MADTTSFSSLSSVISVCIVIIMDGTSTPSATYLRLGRCTGFLQIFYIIMTNSRPGITSMIPCATMAALVLIIHGFELIQINSVPPHCTCTGVSDILCMFFCSSTLIGTHWFTSPLSSDYSFSLNQFWSSTIISCSSSKFEVSIIATSMEWWGTTFLYNGKIHLMNRLLNDVTSIADTSSSWIRPNQTLNFRSPILTKSGNTPISGIFFFDAYVRRKFVKGLILGIQSVGNDHL